MINDTNFPKAADEYARCVSPYFNIEDKQEKYKADKLFKRLRRKVGHAIGDYGMIEENDKILVCMSGGKDSYVLLDMLLSLKRSAPINFELIPVHIDSNFPNAPEYLLEDHLKKVGLKYHFLKRPVYDICKEKIADGIPYCSLCSRLRRGYLYSFAREIGANKVALGHHKDDLTVIRPLIYCRERDLITLSKIKNYPVLPKGLCGFGEDQQRSAMNKMIKQWDKEYPKRADIVFKALKNVAPSHLLDKELFDFTKISNGPKVK